LSPGLRARHGGCRWMPVITPVLGLGHRRWSIFVVLLFGFLSSSYLRAQDVAEAASQKRGQKTEPKQTAPHVYTDEDLRREKILTPEDRARAEARKKQSKPTGGSENAEALPVNPSQQTESLGELARRYRKESEAREEAEAAKKNLGPFPYVVPDPALASPNPDIAPLTKNVQEGSAPGRPGISPQLPPRVRSNSTVPRARISPFQPRPLIATPSGPPVLAVTPSSKVAPPIAYGNSRPVSRPAEAATPYSAPVVESNARFSVQVHRGDSWWKFAERYLGSGARWREIRSLNPVANQPAESLQAGTTIVVPEWSKPAAPRPRTSVVVKQGDTLWGLSREYLGHSSSWGCLANANPQVSDFTRLAIGTTLQLPDSETLKTCRSSNPGFPKR
jgi:nucleoid-associated protein YgaU